jgi:hypothetical protein
MDLALVTLMLGRLAESGAALQLSLPRMYGEGDRWLTADGLLVAAALARLDGRDEDSHVLRAGGRALRESLGAIEMPVERALNERFFASDPPPGESGVALDELVALAVSVARAVAERSDVVA